jgi:hypothetical protein
MDEMTNTLTHNGRFCEMAAVTPQTILCEIERYYPAGTVVEAATSQSRCLVKRKRATVQRTMKWKTEKNCKKVKMS